MDANLNRKLKELIKTALKSGKETDIATALTFMAQCSLIVPCHVFLSKEDAEALEGEGQIGFTPEKPVKLQPVTVEIAGKSYVPAFTSKEERGEKYSAPYSPFDAPVHKLIAMVRANETLSGIVVDPESTPFIIDDKFMGYIIKQITRM